MTRSSAGSAKRRTRWVDLQSARWYRLFEVVFDLLFRFWIRYYCAIGTENVPAEGGTFLVSNHTTGLDPMILGYSMLPRMLRGPGRVELFSHPLWGHIMRKIGMFPLRQRVADPAAIRTVLELYRAGQLVVVYPEGGRSPDGQLQAFEPGVARLIIKMRALVVPAAIAGGTQVMPMGSYFPRRNSPVVVVYGKQFELSEYYDRELTVEVAREAAELMRERVAELLLVAHAERRRLMEKHHLTDV